MRVFTPEGYKVVGMSCNGNKSNFYLQPSLISVIWSKHILGLTTSLALQYKLGPAGQLAMLNEKWVIRKMDVPLVFSVHGAFFLYVYWLLYK